MPTNHPARDHAAYQPDWADDAASEIHVRCDDGPSDGCNWIASEGDMAAIIRRHAAEHLAAATAELREAVTEIAQLGTDWSGHGDAADFYRRQLYLAISLAARAREITRAAAQAAKEKR